MKFFSIFNSKTHPEEPTAFSNAKKVIEVLDSVGDWGEIKDIVEEGAPFVCQADALADVKTIRGWYDWMVNFKANICPDAKFTVKSTAWDAERKVCAHAAVFHATHTGSGGPCEATNKHADTDYFYQVETNDDGKITGMWKIWNDGHCLKQLGWA